MRSTLFERLALATSSLSDVSQAVTMDNANAAQFDVVVFALSGSSPQVSVQLQESNDLENWRDKGSATVISAVGYTLAAAVTGIATAFVRVKVTLSGTTPISVVSIGINTSLQ
jgi:hypothetical protein